MRVVSNKFSLFGESLMSFKLGNELHAVVLWFTLLCDFLNAQIQAVGKAVNI